MYTKCMGQQCDTEKFQKRFFREWKAILGRSHVIKKFELCDFSPIKNHLKTESEKNKKLKAKMTKEEKQKEKEQKEIIAEPYSSGIVDGRKEKIGNFRVEPPGLFRGRGNHPLTGTIKKRIEPEDITINIGENAIVPKAPEGHDWKKIIHDHSATWIAKWIEPKTGMKKYVFFAQDSVFKKKSDEAKYNKSRLLKEKINTIRKKYTDQMNSKQSQNRQLGTAVWIIDNLAIRGGSAKDLKKSADTVGCVTLRVEHIKFKKPNKIILDFLGKDSMRYLNEVKIKDQTVLSNLQEFVKGKSKKKRIFDKINLTQLNAYLKKLMPGLTAKVFRTFNASFTLSRELEKNQTDGNVTEKLNFLKLANKTVAILCNHKKTIPKNYNAQMEKLENRKKDFEKDLKEMQKAIKKNKPWKKMVTRKKRKTKKQREMENKKKLEEEKENRKRTKEDDNNEEEENGEKKNGEKEKEREKEKENGKEEEEGNGEKKNGEKEKENGNEKEKEKENVEYETVEIQYSVKRMKKMVEGLKKKIKTVSGQMEVKDGLKDVALGTSKINYIDPRILVAWSKKNEVPIEKIYTKKLLDKFEWAMKVEKDWVY
ncbi:DNA topoisomerase [Anaeramoeba flamelloides]|uniref:DNA topoisomerase 1 n=1 Tax=Anaeramoeba flamelloides TaxID=1746091 RepID=A0AAV7ZN01_9EUKA|nr:DNA topoisomerase [Anaeramoeba flamelloides]